MPWLLHRALIRELLRVGVLTTLILVTVIAFGATIKPLSRDDLLSAGQVLKYIVLACVPMLQFALPFASGFASTMTLHRMTTDNELVAVAASGISYGKLFAPIAGLGLALTLLMVVLTQSVIPRFWTMLEDTLARDVTLLLQSSVTRGEPFVMGDLQIWADDVVVNDTPTSGADTRMHLFNVAVVDLDEEGRIVADVTAEQVLVDVYRHDDGSEMHLIMDEAVAFKPADGVLAGIDRQEARITLPSVFEDSPKRMSRGELLKVLDDPDRLSRVRYYRGRLAEELRAAEVWDGLRAQLEATGAVRFNAGGATERTYEVRADRLGGVRFRNDDGSAVEIIESVRGVPRRRYAANRVRVRRHQGTPLQSVAFGLTMAETTPDAVMRVDLDIADCEWSDVDVPDTTNHRAELLLENLSGAGIDQAALFELGSGALLERAASFRADDQAVETAAAGLERKLREVDHEVQARLLKRYALSATALLLVLLGASMAATMRESTPLAIYLWAFLPSVLDLILISSGEHMMRDGDLVAGALVMWLGNAILLALFARAFWTLRRH